MEFALILAAVLWLLFGVLAAIDGFYLHLVAYRLYAHADSRVEHWTHTARAVLFPAMLYLLALGDAPRCFYSALVLIGLDLLVLGYDAFLEKDSRVAMGGLPCWEYILHLFVNGIHFAAIALLVAIKVDFSGNDFQIITNLEQVEAFEWLRLVVVNLLPGTLLLAALHLVLCTSAGGRAWDVLLQKIGFAR